MRSLPPLSELRAFEAAARHLSFRNAAAELGVTPTAISHHVRSLERYCGQALFHRRPRPLALTSAGQRLFPALREGFDRFADAIAVLRPGPAGRLRVTATNAFAARWLVPRLPDLRRAHPSLHLEIHGTDALLDLTAGEADVAIRYAVTAPDGLASIELMRDTFHVVGAPRLLRDSRLPLTPRRLARFPIIDYDWPPADANAPTWPRWEEAARDRYRAVPVIARADCLRFREEAHAIEAVIAGQGLALLSDVLVAREFADGTLVRASPVTLPGYGFHLTWRAAHPAKRAIARFAGWAAAAAGAAANRSL
ncbi:MAG: LysR substrate-binding domain-containing protein [Alphaproteobacteria bacterium]